MEGSRDRWENLNSTSVWRDGSHSLHWGLSPAQNFTRYTGSLRNKWACVRGSQRPLSSWNGAWGFDIRALLALSIYPASRFAWLEDCLLEHREMAERCIGLVPPFWLKEGGLYLWADLMGPKFGDNLIKWMEKRGFCSVDAYDHIEGTFSQPH